MARSNRRWLLPPPSVTAPLRSSAIALAALSMFATQALPADVNPFVDAARDRVALEKAIEAERPRFTPPRGVTGITVPHHLLAADLVARGFWAASANQYERIVLIAPDHFRKTEGHFAVAQQDLDTVFGTVRTDGVAVAALLSQPDLFETAADTRNEHGIMVIAPFIRFFFPDTPIVAVAASIHSSADAWRRAAAALESVVTDRTLVVQSTDYSHYLPLTEAIRRDQESLSAIAAREIDHIRRLRQPAHMDSLAAQYIQLALQQDRLGGRPVIIANRSSAEYGSSTDSTTSYIVTVYLRDQSAGSRLRYDDHQLVYLAGDTLLGRFFEPLLGDDQAVQAIVDTVLAFTGGSPLIVNIEGVLLDEPVVGVAPGSHLMQGEAAIPLLRQLNVIAAGLANNHSQDLGPLGFQESRTTLSRNGIRPLTHSEVQDLGAFRVLPLTFLRGRYKGPGAFETPTDAQAVCELDADPPLVALVHWGTEYTDTATGMERETALTLHTCGVSLVVGAHSHQASTRIESLAGGSLQLVFSLGNFLFDQRAERSSGALLEVRAFRQGTIATRLVPIPNLFEIATRHKAPARHDDIPHPPPGRRIVERRANRS